MYIYSNFNHIINIIIQIILLILYIIRYYKFINLKNIFNENKDFILNQYENNNINGYFPNKYFNIDSFALALQINILLFVILNSQFFEGRLIKHEYLKKEKYKYDSYKITIKVLNLLILFFATIIHPVKLRSNLKK